MKAEDPGWLARHCAVVADEGTIDVDGCPIRWLRWGDPAAAPLVLVHGGAASSRWWVPLAPFLATDHCVVAPDLSGMGDSGWRSSGYRTEQWADEVIACVTAATSAPNQAVLVGHSLGGSVAAVAAVRHPHRVRGVVLCDTGVSGSTRTSRTGRHFRNRLTYPSAAEAIERFKLIPRQGCVNTAMVDHIARTSIRPVGPGGPDDPTRPEEADALAWTWKFDWRLFARSYEQPFSSYLDRLGALPLPVACIFGEQSRVVTAVVAERIANHLGPIPTQRIPQAAHHLMLDQPLAFIEALRTVLIGM